MARRYQLFLLTLIGTFPPKVFCLKYMNVSKLILAFFTHRVNIFFRTAFVGFHARKKRSVLNRRTLFSCAEFNGKLS